MDIINETTENLGEIVEKAGVEDGNTQTPAIQKITGLQSFCDTLAIMKRSTNFVKLEEKKLWTILEYYPFQTIRR